MDETKAVRILAKGLAEKVGRLVVSEPLYKREMMKNSRKIQQIGNSTLVEFYGKKFHIGGLSNPELDSLMIEHNSSFAEANYFLLDHVSKNLSNKPTGSTSAHCFLATPIASIGDREAEDLKNLFYKDVPEEIIHALKVLNIHNFITTYQIYSSLDIPSPLDKNFAQNKSKDYGSNFGFYRSFKENEKVGLGDIIQGKSSKKYYLVNKVKLSKVKGYRFFDINLRDKENEKDHGVCDNDHIIPIKKCRFYVGHLTSDFSVLSDDFFRFIINLPPKDHNVNVNKFILENVEDPYLSTLLMKEYSQGEHFQEYFSCLDSKRQKMVANNLKAISERNPAVDSFLWKQGFEIGSLDHLILYKEDSDDFIRYFEGKSDDERKVILNDIMGCEVNKEVVRWLDDNHPKLIREVGLEP